MSRAGIGKMLARYLCPDYRADSVVKVDLAELKQRGYTTLIVDLDNTLVGWKGGEISSEVKEWVGTAARLGYKMHVVSNTFSRRVNKFSNFLGIPAISTALKPRKRVFLEAIERTGSDPARTAVVGDQMFTDVLGGKRLGLFTILVSPVDRREFLTTRLLRLPEKWLLSFFQKSGFLLS